MENDLFPVLDTFDSRKELVVNLLFTALDSIRLNSLFHSISFYLFLSLLKFFPVGRRRERRKKK